MEVQRRDRWGKGRRLLVAHIYQGQKRTDNNTGINHHYYRRERVEIFTMISTPTISVCTPWLQRRPNKWKERRSSDGGPGLPANGRTVGPYGGSPLRFLRAIRIAPAPSSEKKPRIWATSSKLTQNRGESATHRHLALAASSVAE
jgi:hypothetical protein